MHIKAEVVKLESLMQSNKATPRWYLYAPKIERQFLLLLAQHKCAPIKIQDMSTHKRKRIIGCLQCMYGAMIG